MSGWARVISCALASPVCHSPVCPSIIVVGPSVGRSCVLCSGAQQLADLECHRLPGLLVDGLPHDAVRLETGRERRGQRSAEVSARAGGRVLFLSVAAVAVASIGD